MKSRFATDKAFQTDEFAVSHLLQKVQKLRHDNFAVEQRRYESSRQQLMAESCLYVTEGDRFYSPRTHGHRKAGGAIDTENWGAIFP